MNNELVLKHIFSYCTDRNTIYNVCKLWRTNCIWVDPVQSYINALKWYNIRLARIVWEYFSDRICSSVHWKTAFYWSCARGLVYHIDSFYFFKPELEKQLLTSSVRCACMHSQHAVIERLVKSNVQFIDFQTEHNPYHDNSLYKSNMDMKKKFGVLYKTLSCAVMSGNIATVVQLFDLVDRETDGNSWSTLDVFDGFECAFLMNYCDIAEYLLITSTGVEFALDVAIRTVMFGDLQIIQALFKCFEREPTVDLDFLFEHIYDFLLDNDDEGDRFMKTYLLEMCAQYRQFPMHLCDNVLFVHLCEFGVLSTIQRAYEEAGNIDLSYDDYAAFRTSARTGNISTLTFFSQHVIPLYVIEEEVEQCENEKKHGYESDNLLQVLLYNAKRRQQHDQQAGKKSRID